jgi:hypothetical protein
MNTAIVAAFIAASAFGYYFIGSMMIQAAGMFAHFTSVL